MLNFLIATPLWAQILIVAFFLMAMYMLLFSFTVALHIFSNAMDAKYQTKYCEACAKQILRRNELGYRPTNKLDTSNPPKGGSAVPPIP